MFLGATTPSSDALRLAVEAGVVGLSLLLVVAWGCSAGLWRRERSERAALGASLVAGMIHGLFDAPLFRAESVVLLGVVVGLAQLSTPVRSPRFAPHAACAFGVLAACLALLRGASFGPGNGTLAAERSLRILPRADLYETLGVAYARADRCERAAGALTHLSAISSNHWGAAATTALCFARTDRVDEAAARWASVRAREPQLDELATRIVRSEADRNALARLTRSSSERAALPRFSP